MLNSMLFLGLFKRRIQPAHAATPTNRHQQPWNRDLNRHWNHAVDAIDQLVSAGGLIRYVEVSRLSAIVHLDAPPPEGVVTHKTYVPGHWNKSRGLLREGHVGLVIVRWVEPVEVH